MKLRGQILTSASLSFRDLTLKVKEFFSNIITGVTSKFSFVRKQSSQKVANTNVPKRDFKKIIPVAILVISVLIVLTLLSGVTYLFFKNLNTSGRVSVLKPKATQEINREFSFPLFDQDGKEVTRFKYLIEKAELRDEIIVNGKRARSVSGRTFIVLNVKIFNDYNLPMQISSKDYIRLVVDGKIDQAFAADAHSDPVEVQPISAEQTILGFAINETDSNLVIRVGEINKEKQEITLSLK